MGATAGRSAHLGPAPAGRPLRSLFLLQLLLLVCAPGAARAQGAEFPELCSYTWEAVDTKNHMLYTISVCGNVSVPQCGASSAVCAHDLKTNSFRSVDEDTGPRRSPLVVRLRTPAGQPQRLCPCSGLWCWHVTETCQTVAERGRELWQES